MTFRNAFTVKLWDATTGQELPTWTGHTSKILSVTFRPDGKRLASTGYDGTVKLWDGVTGQETLTLKGHTDPVTSVAFSPDGQRLASASWDNTVKIWDARLWTAELRAQSQARGLLTTRREQMQSLDDLTSNIRSDKTISDQVRQQALDWSELFWKNRRHIPKSLP